MRGRKRAASGKQRQQSRSGANSNHSPTPEQSESSARLPRDFIARAAAEPEPHEVGYRKPPIRTQFKKGRSGNPKGRPKQSHNFKTMVKEVLTAPISVREGGKRHTIPKLKAVMIQTVIKALNGDNVAGQTLMKWGAQAGLLNPAEQVVESLELTAAEQAIFDQVKPWIRSRFAKRN